MSDTIMIVGGGGREHALARSFRESFEAAQIYVAPGNAGTHLEGFVSVPNEVNTVVDARELVNFAKKKKVGLLAVGSENQLQLGIADMGREAGIPTFGPGLDAVWLETRKDKAAIFCQEEDIPIPDFVIARSIVEALDFIDKNPMQDWVMKAVGPAGGKGVILPTSRTHAKYTARDMMIQKRFGAAGEIILFQHREVGEELSVIAICNGEDYILMTYTRDFKRFTDKDGSPNTGGIAAYAPVEIDSALDRYIRKNFIEKPLSGMHKRGVKYRGVLYAGLILTSEGPKLIEYNLRFGDPEFEVQKVHSDEPIAPLIWSAAEGELAETRQIKEKRGATALVTLCAAKYPSDPIVGDEIHGLGNSYQGVDEIFHGNTALSEDGKILSNGGRLVHAVSHDETLPEAFRNVYNALGKHAINVKGGQYRPGLDSTQ